MTVLPFNRRVGYVTPRSVRFLVSVGVTAIVVSSNSYRIVMWNDSQNLLNSVLIMLSNYAISSLLLHLLRTYIGLGNCMSVCSKQDNRYQWRSGRYFRSSSNHPSSGTARLGEKQVRQNRCCGSFKLAPFEIIMRIRGEEEGVLLVHY